MKDERLDPNQRDGDQKTCERRPEDEVQQSRVTKTCKDRRAEDRQVERESKPGNRYSRKCGETAVEYLFTAVGDRAGNRFAPFDSQVKCIDESQKRKQDQGKRSTP